MHRTPALILLALAVACYEGADAPVEPGSTPGTPSNELRILGGAVECDACRQLEFTIGGPDLQWVASATFVNSDDSRGVLRARIELRRFTGDSGVVLQARASFSDSIPRGDYDLELLTPGRPGGAGSMRVVRALRVTRASPPTPGPVPPGPQPPGPPVPPGPPIPPAPPLPSGTLRITVTVEGAALDSSFLARSSGCDDYYGVCFSDDVGIGSPAQLRLPASAYRFRLDDVSPNCTVTSANPADVTVVADATTDLAFTVSCVPLGVVEVSVPVTGSDLQEEFMVGCSFGGCPFYWLRAPGPLRLELAPGAYLITLPSYNLRSNCRVDGPDVLAVQVTSGSTTRISFPVTCLPFGEIRVTVNDADPSHAYRVLYPTGCDDYYYPCTAYPLRPGFPALIRVPAGVHSLTLIDVPANCRATSPNPASVAVTSGSTTELAFDVACQ